MADVLKEKKFTEQVCVFADTGHLNDIMTYVVIGVIVMFLVGVTAGAYLKRDYFIKRRTQHAGESCATYDNKVGAHFR